MFKDTRSTTITWLFGWFRSAFRRLINLDIAIQIIHIDRRVRRRRRAILNDQLRTSPRRRRNRRFRTRRHRFRTRGNLLRGWRRKRRRVVRHVVNVRKPSATFGGWRRWRHVIGFGAGLIYKSYEKYICIIYISWRVEAVAPRG